ncbi:MAG: hypothetical protein AB8F65_01440 [Woeseiaceae bacterium]
MADQSVSIDAFIEQHALPQAYVESARRAFLPLASWLNTQLDRAQGGAYVLGINGAQGTGKSTLAALLADVMGGTYDRRVAILSIDDLYMTRTEREVLATKVHPLLRTRGVPGTHDVALGLSLIRQLTLLGDAESVQVPRFDKSTDDRAPASCWDRIEGPLDLIILEGWCVGSVPCDVAALQEPINSLERDEDPEGIWRHYVNQKLTTDYQALFDLLDDLVFLRAPDFEVVHEWRLKQEQKLRTSVGAGGTAIMSDADVARFIQHYERITRANLAGLSERSAVAIELDRSHAAVSLVYQQES